MSKFQPVSPRVNIQDLEHEQLQFWRDKHVFQRTMKEREGAKSYVFYEGPPTANGRPGIHHIMSRAFKDLFPRYRTMTGHYVLRKGGWDTHGLPVEIEVEKELGLKHKSEVEAYGVAAYNKKCRESVLRYLEDWEKLTERMGFWVSLEDAYVTFKNEYIESVWWILKSFWEKDLLYQAYKIVPYCARCGTPLSSHEISDTYKEVDDPSLFVRFMLRDERNTAFLVWTTTPWTLPGNVALAVGADLDYVLVEGPAQYHEGHTERLILAKELAPKLLKNFDEFTVLKTMKGRELAGIHYQPLFDYMPVEQDYAYVITGDFVSVEDGSGIVHIAPAFGADDQEVGRQYNLPTLMTVKPDGTFIEAVRDYAGMWVKDADKPITRNLRERGLLFKSENYRHNYPFCWRCGTPLLYYARETWYIRTTQRRDVLVDLNQTINWVPEHIKDGRFGTWLANNRDWALGRERYWGTPLPVWVCNNPECKHQQGVGSVKELSALAGRDLTDLDLHRPYVDEVMWPCPKCNNGTMKRVPELIDVWFDSGAMPYAQWGYPHKNQEQFESQFPADYICEAIDQTRGWFYSLHAIATLLMDSVAFKNVICLGHILDEKGEKMSKSKGNVVNPWEIMDTNGADAARWYMYTSNPPGDSRRFSKNLVNEIISSFYLTLWNTYSFFVTYANLDNFDPAAPAVPVTERNELDRWALAELHNLLRTVTDAYENYDVTRATRPVATFVDDLSNWYVRRSRGRFWEAGMSKDKLGAYQTLYECLLTLSKLLAPAMPFLAEAMYRNLSAPLSGQTDSVHLAQWPAFDVNLIDEQLIAEMGLAKRLVSLGHSARNSVNLKVRQPLAEASFAVLTPAEAKSLATLADTIAEELNVKQITVMGLQEASDMLRYSLNPLPQKLGKRLGSAFPVVQKVLREGEAATITTYARALLDGQSIRVAANGMDYELTPEEVEVRRNASAGYTVAEEHGYIAALRTELSEDLLLEGLAREVIRRVNSLRREADYALNDHITLSYQASERLTKAIQANQEYVKTETLADTLQATAKPSGDKVESFEFDGETLTVGIRR